MLSHWPLIPPLPANPTPVDTAAFTLATNDLATVQADQAALLTAAVNVGTAIKAALTTTNVTNAQATLTAAITTAKPLIQADLTAILDVYKADEPAVDAAQHQLSVDIRDKAAASVIATDKANLLTAQTTLSNALSAPEAQLTTDKAPVQAAEQAVQTAINTDPGVVAAKATFATDQTALGTAQTQFQTDLAAYIADLKAGI